MGKLMSLSDLYIATTYSRKDRLIFYQFMDEEKKNHWCTKVEY